MVDYTSALAAQGSTSFTVGQAAGSGSYATGSSGQTLSDGSFYWRVKAIDDDSAESSYSTANSGSVALSVDATAPSVPGTPTSSSATTDTTPLWSWTASTDAGSGLAAAPYTLQWSQSSDFLSGVSSATSVTNSYTHTAALADGTWYFRVKAADTLGNESGYASAGSITIDATAPAAFDLDSPGNNVYTNAERPAFRWKATSDVTGSLAKYVLEIDNPSLGDREPAGDFTIDNIPVSRVVDYETNTYIVRYENFSDADATNNYLSLSTRSHSDWSTSQNDGKLREGRVTWRVKAVDNSGNTATTSRVLFVDRYAPAVTFTQVNEVPFFDAGFSTTDKTPTVFGKISDALSGGNEGEAQGENGPQVASGPKQVDIKVEKLESLGARLITLYTINMDAPWYTCTDQAVDDNAKQRCDKYLPFAYTVRDELEQGIYRLTFSGKDKTDNISREMTLTLRIASLARLATPEEMKIIEEAVSELPEGKQIEVKEALEITKATVPGDLEKADSSFQKLMGTISKSIGDMAAAIGNAIGNTILTALQATERALVFVGIKAGQLAVFWGSSVQHNFGVLASVYSGVFTGVQTGIGNGLGTAGQALSFVGAIAGQGITGMGELLAGAAGAVGNGYNRIAAGAPGAARFVLNGIGHAVSMRFTEMTETTEWAEKLRIVFAESTALFMNSVRRGAAGAVGSAAGAAGNGINVIKNGVVSMGFAIGEKTQDVASGFSMMIINFAYKFVSEPTTISAVKVEVISSTSVKISWKTNHPANGKVNYGLDRTYPFDVQSEKRVTLHEFVLTDLTPDTVYHFEVMSHNNNYVYDANREFRTPKADEAGE